MNQDPVRAIQIKGVVESQLLRNTVVGLNLFEYHNERVSKQGGTRQFIIPENDPRLVFLSHLCQEETCSVYVGDVSLNDQVDTPEEMFDPSKMIGDLTQIKLGYYQTLYGTAKENGALLSVGMDLFNSASRDNVLYLLETDSVALFFGGPAQPETILTDVAALLTGLSQPGQTESTVEMAWRVHQIALELLTRIFRVVILPAYDGWYFDVYSRYADALSSLLDPAIADAAASIAREPWFQNHQGAFHWDAGAQCLSL